MLHASWYPNMYSPDPTAHIPRWLNSLANAAVGCFVELGDQPPVGCHFHHDCESATWEVALFVGRAEISGGRHDGSEVPVTLVVNVFAVCALFDAQPEVEWQSVRGAVSDDVGTHLAFAGHCQGHRILLRILEEPPEWAGVGRLVDGTTGRFRDLW